VSAEAVEPSPTVDRRRLRSERGRDQVVAALLALYDEGDPEPSAARIAARAGVSERSVFRYFDDLESLAATTVEQQLARIREHVQPLETAGDLDTRVAALVEHRLDFQELVAPVARAGRLIEHRSRTVADAFAWRRRLLREQVAAQFAPELAGATGRARTRRLDALDAATCFEHVDHLRTDLGWSRSRVRDAVVTTLRALLA
jgi:AcrR family transcriptional regulator